MNPDLAIDLFKTTVMFALYIVSPFLIATLLVGLLASLLQSVTNIQEPTLTFVPKLLVLAGLALLVTPWMLRALSEFTVNLITRMGGMGH